MAFVHREKNTHKNTIKKNSPNFAPWRPKKRGGGERGNCANNFFLGVKKGPKWPYFKGKKKKKKRTKKIELVIFKP